MLTHIVKHALFCPGSPQLWSDCWNNLQRKRD